MHKGSFRSTKSLMLHVISSMHQENQQRRVLSNWDERTWKQTRKMLEMSRFSMNYSQLNGKNRLELLYHWSVSYTVSVNTDHLMILSNIDWKTPSIQRRTDVNTNLTINDAKSSHRTTAYHVNKLTTTGCHTVQTDFPKNSWSFRHPPVASSWAERGDVTWVSKGDMFISENRRAYVCVLVCLNGLSTQKQ